MADRPTPPNPNNLPDLAGGETVTNADAIVRYIPVGPRRLSLLQTAAYLTANGWTVTAPGGTPTITALTFASAGSIAANSPVNTVLGTLSYTATGGALVNPVLSLADNAGGKLKVVGAQVQLALGNVAQGSYAFRARIAADNAAAREQDFSVTIAAVATPPTVTGITLTLAGSVTANSAAETLVGTLAAQTTGGALVNPAWTLVNTAGGDFKLNGGTNGVRFAVNNVPAGTFTIRAQVTSDNVAAFQQDLTITVTAAIVGAGEGLDFDFGYGRAADLAVPFSYKAATAMPVGEVVQFAQPSAAKDLPAGWRWYATDAGGNRVDVQQDMEGTFGADGSLETAALTITNGTARTAGTVVPLTLKAEQVAPNRTPLITHAQVRAELANLKMEATGYDLGSDTLVMPAAWVMDNCKEWTAASPGWIATPGVAPVGGWQYLKRGPQCVDLQIWGYYRNTALTASHKWLRVDLLCQRLANGAWDFGVVQSQPNTFNAHPSGTLGTTRQARIACTARLMDGASVLHAWGGAGDPNAVVRPLTAIDRTSGRIDFAGGFADDHGGDGAVIGITGSDLPAGVVSGQTLGHVKYDGSGSVLALERNRLDAGKVSFGDGGSGNATFTPLCTTWPNGFAALYTPQGERVRWGGVARPLVLPMHDRGYLTQRAKVVPAMNPALPNIKLPNQFKPKHILGTAVSFSYALQATSNNEDDDRLGFITSTQASLLWAPDDEARHRRAVVNSLGFMTFHIAHIDEEAGTPVVYNRGPLAVSDGSTRYAGMGANTPGWTAYAGYNSIGIGAYNTQDPAPRTPGHFYQVKWKQEIGVPGWSGYENQYDVLLEGSHAPNHHLVPWLRSADFVHLMALRACAVVAMNSYSGMSTAGGKTNLALDSGGRTMAWPLALAITAEGALPDVEPGKAFLFDLVEHTGRHLSGPRLATHLGRFIGQVGGKGASYMMAYLHMVWAQILLQGKHPSYRLATENGAIWSVAQYDDQQGPIPNGAYSFGLYGNDADNTIDSGDGYGGYPHYWPSLMAFKEATQGSYGTLPFPSTGVRDGSTGLTYTSRAEMCVLRQFKTAYYMGVLGAGAASAGRVEAQVLARLAADGKTLAPGSNGTTTLFPQWDMVSFLPPQVETTGPNTGNNYDFGFGRQATLAIPFPHMADGAVAQGDVLSIAQGFGAGDVRTAARLVGQVGSGTPFEIQRDLDNTHEGTLRAASLAWPAPVTLADGAEGSFTIKEDFSTPPNRTPFMTAAQIAAATDVRVVLSGYDYAAGDMEASFNWIIANCAETASDGSRGTNPIGFWEYRKRGPHLVEVMAACYVRAVSGGAMSRWQRCDLYLTAINGATVRYKLDVRLWQPNAFAAHPAGTIGPAVNQVGIACIATVKNGANVIGVVGGTNDPRAFDVAASAFSGQNLTMAGGALASENPGKGIPLAFSGTLPAGLTAGTVYYGEEVGGNQIKIAATRLQGDYVNFSGGSGTIRVMPLCHTYPNCSTPLATTTGKPFWIGTGAGAGSEPSILPAHDLVYLGKRARLTPLYDLSYAVGEDSGERAFTYVPGAATYFSRDWQQTSDGDKIDRIGNIPYRGNRALRAPYAKKVNQNIFVQALTHATHIWNIADETSGGRPVVHVPGTFAGLGAANPGFRAAEYQAGNPAYGGANNGGWSGTDGYRKPGTTKGYGMVYPGTHATQFNLVPYFKSGRTIFADLMESMVFTMLQAEYDDNQISVGGRALKGVVTSGSRTSAWCYSIASDYQCIVADSNPAKALLDSVLTDALDAHEVQALSGSQKNLGVLFQVGRPWMLQFNNRAFAKFLMRGRHPQARACVETMARQCIDLFDDEGEIPYGGALLAMYGFNNNTRPAGGEWYSSNPVFANLTPWAELMAGAQPYPATGYYDFGAFAKGDRAEYGAIGEAVQQDFATCHEWGLAYIPKASRVASQSHARRRTAPNNFDTTPGVETWQFIKATLPDEARVLLTAPTSGTGSGSGGTGTGTGSGSSGGSGTAQFWPAGDFAIGWQAPADAKNRSNFENPAKLTTYIAKSDGFDDTNMTAKMILSSSNTDPIPAAGLTPQDVVFVRSDANGGYFFKNDPTFERAGVGTFYLWCVLYIGGTATWKMVEPTPWVLTA